MFCFLIEIWTEIIIASHAVVRNNKTLNQFPRMVAFCRSVVWYYSQAIDAIYQSWLHLQFNLYSCVFVFSSVVLSHVWICGSTTTIQILNSTRILLVALVNSDTHFPPTIPLLSLAPNWFATSKKAWHKCNYIVYNLSDRFFWLTITPGRVIQVVACTKNFSFYCGIVFHDKCMP